jgi:hypothetical protein
LLSEGELGYSVDTRRLFIGDGYNLGGNPVSNLNFGNVLNIQSYLPYAVRGDTIKSNNLNYILGTDQTQQNAWVVDMPGVYTDAVSIGGTFYYYNILEYAPAPDNRLRIRAGSLGDGFTVDYLYGGTGSIASTIQNVYSTLNFDARFISLCAFRSVNIPNDSYPIGSLYFGNIFTKTIKNNLSATVNVERNVSINDHTLSAYQLQMYARDLNVNGSLIDATSGSLYLRSKGPIYLGTGTSGGSGLSISDTNVTVYGNLSVLGDLAYLNSVVSVTSALSVVNNGTGPAFVVNQKGTQPVAHFQDDGATALFIADGGKVGIGTTVPDEKLTVSGNISSNGTLYTQSITSRGIDLIHLPVTDGIDPILRIGESNYGTGYNGFSGAFMSYDELTNTFGISSVFADTQWGIPAIAVDRTGKVGIGTDFPTQKLTVSGNISVDGNITIGGNSTLGDAGTDTTIIRGIAKIADSSSTNGILLGTGDASYDTNIYRNAANALKTDDNFTVDLDLNVNGNSTLGNANTDTTIIRGIAKIADSSATNGILFGTGDASYDVNLYRDSANNLKTDDNLTVAGTTTLNSTVTLADAVNIVLNTTTGSKIGTATTQKLGFYNATPIVQPTSPGLTAPSTTGSGTTLFQTTKFNGGAGTEYSVADIVKVLKNLGLIAA